VKHPLTSVPALMLFLAATAATAAAAPPPAKPAYPTSVPPAAELIYGIRARQGGLAINGESEIHWLPAGGRYSLTVETRAMLVGKILDEKSEGAIDAWGLAPVSYTEQRFRKAGTSVTFDREAKMISFSASDRSYPIHGGEQDRASVVWQLSAAARAAPAKFKSGSTWNFFVVGQRDADPWTFNVGEQENVAGPDGDLMAWHVTRNPPPGSEEQQLDIWLAPTLQWYPVRLRFTEGGGDFIEKTLRQVRPK
jgi:hypothetical protein